MFEVISDDPEYPNYWVFDPIVNKKLLSIITPIWLVYEDPEDYRMIYIIDNYGKILKFNVNDGKIEAYLGCTQGPYGSVELESTVSTGVFILSDPRREVYLVSTNKEISRSLYFRKDFASISDSTIYLSTFTDPFLGNFYVKLYYDPGYDYNIFSLFDVRTNMYVDWLLMPSDYSTNRLAVFTPTHIITVSSKFFVSFDK